MSLDIYDKLQNLLDAANETTGAGAEDLTEGVQALVDGYGQGSEPVIEEKNITANGTYTAPAGVDGYSPVNVNVPTGTARDASDVSISGRTVNVAPGLYSSQVTKYVPTGTEGTPTANKSISGHTATVQPRVTNVAGYIFGGTKNGTPVTVSAAELASGTKSITENGNGIDVVGYESVDVNVQGGGGGVIPIFGDTKFAKGASDIPTQFKLESHIDKAGISFSFASYDVEYFDLELSGISFAVISPAFYIGTADNVPVRKITRKAGENTILYATRQYCFNRCNKLEEVSVPFDLSTMGGVQLNMFNQCVSLKTIVCVPNTASYALNFNTCNLLTDASIVSIANALMVNNLTLTLHTTTKSKLATIMGTVSQQTDETGTYDFFTASASGTVPLQNFITQNKGWTIA